MQISYISRFLCYAAASFFLAAALHAQVVGGGVETKLQLDWPYSDEHFGHSVSGAGDLNGDGTPDFIVGIPEASCCLDEAGLVEVYSGVDGSLMAYFEGYSSFEHRGCSVSGAGDVNADGFDDIIFGAWGYDSGGVSNRGLAFVYSGVDNAFLEAFTGEAEDDFLGWSVSDAGDLDHDGHGDLIVGAYGADPGGLSRAGSAFVYSGADGSLLFRFDGDTEDAFLGAAVSGAGDVNGDGTPDLIVGAWGHPSNGSAYVYSGLDGSLIWQWLGGSDNRSLGFSVSGAGDVNGDGYDDVLVGDPEARPHGFPSEGLAYAYSGFDGSLLWSWSGTGGGHQMGYSVSGAGNVDGDGFADVIVGARFLPEGRGSARVYAGASGLLIWQLEGSAIYDLMGCSVSGAGDLDGDGSDDVIAGASQQGTGGAVHVFGLDSFVDQSATEVSSATGGIIGYHFDFPDEAAGYRYRLLLSAAGTGPTDAGGVLVPLGMDRLLLRSFFGQYPPLIRNRSSNLQGRLDLNGMASAYVGIPAGRLGAHVGRTIHVAGVAVPPAGPPAWSSTAIRLDIVP